MTKTVFLHFIWDLVNKTFGNMLNIIKSQDTEQYHQYSIWGAFH